MVTFKKNGTLDNVDPTIDASLYAVGCFGVYDPADERVTRTMQAIRDRLWCKTSVGGIARYENDYYHQVSHDVANLPANPRLPPTPSPPQCPLNTAPTPPHPHHPLPPPPPAPP